MPGEVFGPQSHLQFFGLLQRLDDRRREPGYRRDHPLDPLGRLHERVQIIAVHLDRDLGVDARHHVADEVGQRLLHLDRYAWDLTTELVEQLLDDLLAMPAGVGIDGEDVFARIHWRRMLVEFGPARPADKGEDLAAWPFIGLLQAPEFRVDEAADGVRCLQRRARRQGDVHLNAPLVERREEIAAQPGELPAGDGHADPGEHEQEAGHRHAQANERRGEALEAGQQHPVVLAVRGGRLRQEIEGEHRRHRQRHHQRRQDRDDVGHGQRGKQPALDARQGEQRQEHEDHDRRAEHDRPADLTAGLVDHPQGRQGHRAGVVLLQPPVDVLDVHDGVVHEFSHRHGDPAQGHDVDRERRAGDHPGQTEDERRDHQ